MAGAVYQTLLTSGSGLPASTINLVSGERLGFSHGAPTLRRICRGDGGNVELGAAFKRYTATLGRQLSLDPPPARIRKIHDARDLSGDVGQRARLRRFRTFRSSLRKGEVRSDADLRGSIMEASDSPTLPSGRSDKSDYQLERRAKG